MFVKQSKTKPQETQKFKRTKPSVFSFKIPFELGKNESMLGSIRFEVCNSVLNMTKESIKSKIRFDDNMERNGEWIETLPFGDVGAANRSRSNHENVSNGDFNWDLFIKDEGLRLVVVMRLRGNFFREMF